MEDSNEDEFELSLGSIGTFKLSGEALRALQILDSNKFSQESINNLSDIVIGELTRAGLFVEGKPVEILPVLYNAMREFNLGSQESSYERSSREVSLY